MKRPRWEIREREAWNEKSGGKFPRREHEKYPRKYNPKRKGITRKEIPRKGITGKRISREIIPRNERSRKKPKKEKHGTTNSG
mgnify:FL=1